MPTLHDPVNGHDLGYNENLAEANNAEFGEEAVEIILPPLAEGIAASASDPEEALDMCRDIAAAEELDDDQFLELVRLVEDMTDWELPGPPERS